MKKIIFILLTFFLINSSQAQIIDPVKWEISIEKINKSEIYLVFSAQIEAPWHMYSQHFDSGGPMKMTWDVIKNKNFKRIGEVIEVTETHKEKEAIFDINVAFWNNKSVLKQKIRVLSEKEFKLKAIVDYQTCTDVQCVNFTKFFTFEIKGIKAKYIKKEDIVEIKPANIIEEKIDVEKFTGMTEIPKYGNFLHTPHQIKAYFDYEQALRVSKKEEKPLFVNFTGHGCVSNREMETNVWSNPRVLELLKNKYVIVSLFVDDKTRLPEDEWITSTFDGKIKNTIGKINSDFQITRFRVNAQPYYVLLDLQEKMLVKPRSYSLDVKAFILFLETGIKEFHK